jgi:HrpA-like RNA helicase
LAPWLNARPPPLPPAGADEISRICRALSSSARVAAAAGGGGALVLPLHGGLPPSQQARVFNRPPKGAPRGF